LSIIIHGRKAIQEEEEEEEEAVVHLFSSTVIRYTSIRAFISTTIIIRFESASSKVAGNLESVFSSHGKAHTAA
jgi:Flp pilus assembly pilin Flp